jgi:hypothetical protein
MKTLRNNQHRTSNNQHQMVWRSEVHWLFDVGCWVLEIFEFPGGARE